MDSDKTLNNLADTAELVESELAQFKQDPAVVGYATITKGGEEIELDSLWEETAPIFANLFDIADRIGGELGEEHGCSTLTSDCKSFELLSTSLKDRHVVVLKRKQKSVVGGLSNVR